MADNSAQPQGPPAQPIAPAPPIQHLNAPGAAGAQQNQPAPARRDRKPRKDAMSVSNATISGIPPMLQLVATTGFHTVQHLNISRFVPSFNAAAMVINAMNFQMAYTHRFLQGAPAWIPPVSYLYFGVLFMIQTLRAQRESGAMHADLLWLLEGVEKLYDLRSLLVAGPLVPYFQTLSAFAGPFERIGDVTPVLPWTWDCTAANHYMLRGHGNTPMHRVVPGIPMYMDIIQRIIGHAGDFTEAQRRIFFTSIMNVNAAQNANNRFMMQCPGACFPITFTLQQLNSAKYALANINFPPALDPAATGNLDTWAKYMRFYSDADVFFPWFSQIASIMQRYCQFMQGSVPLSAIPPSGTAAGLPVWTYAAGNANFINPSNFVAAVGGPNAVAAHYTQNEQISLSAHGSHPDETLEEVSEQTSAIALTNVDFATATGAGGAPANAGLRDGPVWNLPEVRRTPNVDYALGIPSTITTHYHSDTRHT